MNTPTPSKNSFPTWATELARTWNAGSHSLFILHGNIFDYFPLGEEKGYGSLNAFLATRIFPNRQFLMFYDIADGLTFADAAMQGKFFRWFEIYCQTLNLTGRVGGQLPKDFRDLMPILRQFITQNQDIQTGDDRGITLIIEYPEKIAPNTSGGGASGEERLAIVSLLKFASANRGRDVGIFLVAESILDLSDDLTKSPYVAQVRIDLPGAAERKAFLESPTLREITGKEVGVWAGMPSEELAKRTAGLNLARIQNLVAQTVANNVPWGPEALAEGKKKLIEEYCRGLVTFKEATPGKTLENVANHTAAKAKLAEIAWLVKNGKNNVLEKGILIPGRIGVGKTYLVECFASECGLPVLELGNFRSKWVGDTEKQLSSVLITLRALGPVVVVVDEADAVFGNSRGGENNDSGVSNRVFAALAAHIGDSELRGQEIWIAMTSRPDLLAIDMKRQGRFGLCIPLFPTQNSEEVRVLFQTVAKTKRIMLGCEELTEICELLGKSPLTGSDADAILTRAQERAVLAQREHMTADDLAAAVENFIDALDPQLLALQELAGVLACSDRRYLPEKYRQADREELRRQFEQFADRE